MTEELNMTMDICKDSLVSTIDHLQKELSKVRAGKASPAMLADVMVDYYGSATPISQVANVNNLDPRTLTIQPWEKSLIQEIEKAIFGANLGVTPQNDGEMIRITLPPLTEERRKDLAKKIRAIGEDAKIGIRTARKSANDEIKNLVKDGLSEDMGKTGEAKVQDLVKSYSETVEKYVSAKEKEIMAI